MDSIYDPAEVYDVELLNDDDIDDNKSDQDNGECNISEGGTMDHQDASVNKLLITDATENINMVDDGATNDGNTAAAEEDADGNKERFSRTERENMKVSVMQRLSPSIDSSLSRDTAKSGKGNYSRLIVLNLPVSCSVDQLKEFINSKLNSGVTLDKVEGIYVGAAMVWITPVSAIGEVASLLKDCVLDDRKVVARKMSSRDYDIFAQKKAKAMAGPQLQNRGARAAANGLWRAALRNINTSLSAEQLENIFKKRAEGVIKVQMIPDNKSGSNKKHIGRGHVTFETRDLAARFCRKIGNTIVGGRNVVARMETKPLKDQTKRAPGPARSSPKPASKLAPRPPHYRLTVTGVSVEVSAKELEEIFSSEVSSPVRAHLAPTEGAPHAGTGFLEFRKEEAAYTAHTLLNGTDIGGSCITLTLDIEKGSEPEEEVEPEAAEGDSSDVMEISIQEPEKEEEQGLSLGQRSRSRDSDSRREREDRNRKEERDNRDSERERDQERERRARARENDRDARVRSRSPLRTADRGGEGRRVEGVMILRNLDELRRKTRGARFRAHVSNIAYTMTEGKMISLINQQVTGLESILACQFSDGKFKGVMILEFVSPAAVENFIDKMASFNVNNRKIVIKRDSDNSLRDGRARRNSPPRSRDDRPPRPRDMSPMRQPHQMGHNPHVGPDRMGPDHMMRQGMQLGGPPMQASMGHPSQMGGMNQMMSGMDHRMNPAIGMAGGPQMGGPAYGPGQQMAGGFGMNRSLGGVSARLGDIMPAQSGLMDQGTAFMNAQQQQQHHQQPPPQQQQQQQQPPVVVVPETSQRQLVALPSTTGDVNTETYGLSTTFLASLNIKLPLVKELLVINLDSAATDADVKDLFSIAGTVSKIQYNKVKGQAIVEMAHPVEAVQAVSMLHNQEYFDRVLGVRLLRPNDPDNLVTRSVVPAVPRGLKTIGKGLGIDGLPLSTVLQPPVALTPQQQRQPQQSVIADPCMQRPPPNKAGADKPLFAFPPPPQLPMQNVPLRRGQAAGTNKQGRDGRGDNNPFETSRKAEKKAERASRWERQNTYQKTAAPDTWATKRDSGSVDRDRQDGSDSSKNRFRESGDQGYCQPSTDRVMDMPRHYESVDANRNGPPRGRNISRGGDMNEGFGGGGGRQEDQYNNTNKTWINDRADFKNSSYGNQSESGRFSNNSSSNSGRDQGRASRDGLSWDDSGRSAPVKTPSSYGTDEENRNFSSDNQNRNYSSDNQNRNYSSDNQNRNYSSDNQNRNYNYNNRSGGYPNGSGDSLNTSESKFSDSRASIATLGAGSRESSLLGGYAAQSRGGGFGSESAAVLAPSSSSLRSSLTSIMSSSNVGREVILSNLPSNAKQQTIVDMCLPYGVVRNVVLNSAQRSGRVVFDSYQQATMAADILNDQNYNGAVLSAMLA